MSGPEVFVARLLSWGVIGAMAGLAALVICVVVLALT